MNYLLSTSTGLKLLLPLSNLIFNSSYPSSYRPPSFLTLPTPPPRYRRCCHLTVTVDESKTFKILCLMKATLFALKSTCVFKHAGVDKSSCSALTRPEYHVTVSDPVRSEQHGTPDLSIMLLWVTQSSQISMEHQTWVSRYSEWPSPLRSAWDTRPEYHVTLSDPVRSEQHGTADLSITELCWRSLMTLIY